MLLSNLAQPEWISVPCENKLLQDVICEVKGKGEVNMEPDINLKYAQDDKTCLAGQILHNSIGGSRGRRRRATPNRINFFHFCIRFCQKMYASEVGTPQWVGAPPTGNPGSATE